MPVKSKQQLKFMGMCAKNPEMAKDKCPPKTVAQEFLDAPKPKNLPKKVKKTNESNELEEAFLGALGKLGAKAAYGLGKAGYNTGKWAARKGLKAGMMGGAALARGGSNLTSKLAKYGADKADSALAKDKTETDPNKKMGFMKKMAVKAGRELGNVTSKHADKFSAGLSKHIDPRVDAAKKKYLDPKTYANRAKKAGAMFDKSFWNYESLNSNFPHLTTLLEQYRVRSPKELEKLRQDARSERMARKKGKLSGKAMKRSKARQGALKADAQEDAIYSRDFRTYNESFKSVISELVAESYKNYDKWTKEAHGSAETPERDQADIQAELKKHPANPANKKKKRMKQHYGKIKTPKGEALDIDYPSDSGRY